ncbi:MAG: SH3 domain-containing protein [Chromatiaceae bacterium]
MADCEGGGHQGGSHAGGGGSGAAYQAHQPDYADGLAGGPDFWEVVGVPAGDTLNLRSGPSAHDRVVGEIGNGSVMRNLGCKMAGGQRWCRVGWPKDSGSQGWVAGRYLRESSYQP